MKPIFSEEEKTQAVRTFLIACRHKKAKIISYKDIQGHLNSGTVKVLFELAKSGEDQIEDRYMRSIEIGEYYTEGDARVYFEWLVAAVSGALPNAIEDDLVRRANNQLFNFIQIMQQSGNVDIDHEVQMIEPYDWQKLFISFDERLTDMQRIIDKGDKDIIEVLKTLTLFLKENKTLLKQIKKENEGILGKER